jgi:cystathionine beta-lyase family protein involved in aluminum resistance
MFLRFDHKNLTLDLIVGVGEKYTPKRKITKLNEKVQQLKLVCENKLEDTFKTKDIQHILTIVKDSSSKSDEWRDFLSEVYVPEVKKILEEVKKINEKICPNYAEHVTTA